MLVVTEKTTDAQTGSGCRHSHSSVAQSGHHQTTIPSWECNKSFLDLSTSLGSLRRDTWNISASQNAHPRPRAGAPRTMQRETTKDGLKTFVHTADVCEAHRRPPSDEVAGENGAHSQVGTLLGLRVPNPQGGVELRASQKVCDPRSHLFSTSRSGPQIGTLGGAHNFTLQHKLQLHRLGRQEGDCSSGKQADLEKRLSNRSRSPRRQAFLTPGKTEKAGCCR